MRDFPYAPTPELEAVLPRARNLDDLLTRRDFHDAVIAPGIFDERLCEYAAKLVGAWMNRYDAYRTGRSEMHGLDPVALATVEALHAGCSVGEASTRIASAAVTATDRATARAALLGIGRTDLVGVVRSFVGAPRGDALAPVKEPLGGSRIEAPDGPQLGVQVFRVTPVEFPLYVWDHDRFPDAAAIPEDVQALFPVLEMPHCQVYLLQESFFGVSDRTLETLQLLASFGLTELEFGETRFDTVVERTVDVGATVAVHEWQLAVSFGRHDDERIGQARRLLEQSVAAGGMVNFEAVVDAIADDVALGAVVSDALDVVIGHAPTPAQRFEALAAAREALAQAVSDDPLVAATVEGLRRQVDLLAAMEASRGGPEGPESLGHVSG